MSKKRRPNDYGRIVTGGREANLGKPGTGLFAGGQGFVRNPLDPNRIYVGGDPVTARDKSRLNRIMRAFPRTMGRDVLFQRFWNLDRRGREAYLRALERDPRVSRLPLSKAAPINLPYDPSVPTKDVSSNTILRLIWNRGIRRIMITGGGVFALTGIGVLIRARSVTPRDMREIIDDAQQAHIPVSGIRA